MPAPQLGSDVGGLGGGGWIVADRLTPFSAINQDLGPTTTESASHAHGVTIGGQTGGISADHTHKFTSGTRY